MTGKTILHYKILEKLGEGGMGTVYKAQDTKLDRFVALKFLPAQFTAAEEEKARFIREAKAASALNHPNVCTIYDIQELDDQLFIVMEFLDGKTLRDKKDNLSQKQILEIGIQIAEGLAAAHEKGIVHRDIKPENIMLRKDGIAQIMDFGLAKLYSSGNVSRLTKTGTTMGTLGYMSPEQVQGLDTDLRTDIFSLGVVLYELLAGESPFKGIHETAVMYEIVNVDPPPISSIKESIDPQLDAIILECLEKDKDDRCQSAKELAKDLRKIKKSASERKSRVYNVNSASYNTQTRQAQISDSSGSVTSAKNKNRFVNRKMLLPVILISVIVLGCFAFFYFDQKPNENYLIRFIVAPTEGASFAPQSPVISPDGKQIVFIARDSTEKSMLWLRSLESVISLPIRGTENVMYPFWSPDSRYICYYNNGKLNKLNISTNTDQSICDVSAPYGGTWENSNTILFSPTFFSEIYKVDAAGGTPVPVTKLDKTRGEESHLWPQYLPDGHHFIYSAYSTTDGNNAIYVGSLKNDIKQLVCSISGSKRSEKFVFVSPDYIFFLKNNSLMVQKFDLSNYKLINEPTELTSNVTDFSVSKNVILVTKNSTTGFSNLILFDRKGNQLHNENNLGLFLEMTKSPDENRIAYHRIYGPEGDQINNQDIWLFDRKRGTTSRFTDEPGADIYPIWSPDGITIVYASNNDSVYNIYEKSVNSNNGRKLLLKTQFGKYPLDWSSDGKYILFNSQDHLWILPMFGNKKPYMYLQSPVSGFSGSFSPDSKWIAYCLSETGNEEVYIQDFPDGKQKFQVSLKGGTAPRWGKDENELFFISPDQKLMSVEINKNSGVTIGVPRPLFNINQNELEAYLVIDNNTHFLLNSISANYSDKPFDVIVNWKNILHE